MARQRPPRPDPLALGPAERQAEFARRRLGRNAAVLVVLLLFALLLYGLAMVKLAGRFA